MLDISAPLMLITAIVFVVLLITLNAWLFKPMLHFMEEREKTIRKDIEDASQNSADITLLHKEASNLIAKAKAEAAAIREAAISQAKASALNLVEERKRELAGEYEAFLLGLEKEQIGFKNSLMSQLPLYKSALKAKFSQL